MAGERAEKMFRELWHEYWLAERKKKGELLNEFCRRRKYHRKYAIALLGNSACVEKEAHVKRRRKRKYSGEALQVLCAVWEAARYPWSVRLKAMLPLWVPWVRRHGYVLGAGAEAALLRMSPRQMDRILAPKRRLAKKRLYGCTKPGTLLRRQIPVRTTYWDAKEPGYTEGDTVSHSGPSATGEWIHSLYVTDILSCWVETRAAMGNSEQAVSEALEDIRKALPFPLLALDTDNGSEFINRQVVRYCQKHKVAFTRSRPYKKDDNAHIEQKNWTHVRKVFGWERYDTASEQEAMNALYSGPLRQMMNLFQPCVKLVEKRHAGTRVSRRYDAPATPLDRLVAYYGKDALPPKVALMVALRRTLDPLALARAIERGLDALNRPPAKAPTLPANRRPGQGCPRAALPCLPKEASHATLLR